MTLFSELLRECSVVLYVTRTLCDTGECRYNWPPVRDDGMVVYLYVNSHFYTVFTLQKGPNTQKYFNESKNLLLVSLYILGVKNYSSPIKHKCFEILLSTHNTNLDDETYVM